MKNLKALMVFITLGVSLQGICSGHNTTKITYSPWLKCQVGNDELELKTNINKDGNFNFAGKYSEKSLQGSSQQLNLMEDAARGYYRISLKNSEDESLILRVDIPHQIYELGNEKLNCVVAQDGSPENLFKAKQDEVARKDKCLEAIKNFAFNPSSNFDASTDRMRKESVKNIETADDVGNAMDQFLAEIPSMAATYQKEFNANALKVMKICIPD